MRHFLMLSSFCLLLLQLVSSYQLDSRKIDVINEWIDRIKSAPKGHSMSPSWTSKSIGSIKPLGVSSLPLQNERVDHQQYPHHSFAPHNRQNQKRPTGFPGKLFRH